MSEYYVIVDTVEQDGHEWNHLLTMVVKGQEYLVSATTDHRLGGEGSRLWVSWSELSCHTITTIEDINGRIVSGSVNLCTAYGIGESL